MISYKLYKLLRIFSAAQGRYNWFTTSCLAVEVPLKLFALMFRRVQSSIFSEITGLLPLHYVSTVLHGRENPGARVAILNHSLPFKDGRKRSEFRMVNSLRSTLKHLATMSF